MSVVERAFMYSSCGLSPGLHAFSKAGPLRLQNNKNTLQLTSFPLLIPIPSVGKVKTFICLQLSFAEVFRQGLFQFAPVDAFCDDDTFRIDEEVVGDGLHAEKVCEAALPLQV